MVSQLAPRIAQDPALAARLRELPAHLASKIRGQDHLLPRIVSALTRSELGLAAPKRPRGCFLLVGPTGVGKTELTNVFTSFLNRSARPVRFDMSEYQLQHSVDKLLGESRDDPGLLGRALSNVPSGTLLFDEIEKAHPLAMDLFLQMTEDARITIATGDTLELSSFYIVCTSNIGSEEIMRMQSAPFASVERTVLMRVRERMRPELVSRFNEIVVFSSLNYTTQRAICLDMIESEMGRLLKLGYSVEISFDAIEFLVREGYHRSLGVRPMRGAVERFIQGALAYSILYGQAGSGRLVVDESGLGLKLVGCA